MSCPACSRLQSFEMMSLPSAAAFRQQRSHHDTIFLFDRETEWAPASFWSVSLCSFGMSVLLIGLRSSSCLPPEWLFAAPHPPPHIPFTLSPHCIYTTKWLTGCTDGLNPPGVMLKGCGRPGVEEERGRHRQRHHGTHHGLDSNSPGRVNGAASWRGG